MKKIFAIFLLNFFILSANAEMGGTITRSIETDDENMMTTTSIDATVEPQNDEIMTIMGDKSGGDTSDGKVYKGSSLSENDSNLYNHLKETLSTKNKKTVENFSKKLNDKLSKVSAEKKTEILKKLKSKVSDKISQITLKYPQDKALPEKVNNIYLTLKYLELEIMQIK